MNELPWNQQCQKDKCVLVIGDLILDNYLLGTVNRISPEAPVPVHRIEKKFQLPGGAANVAINCARHKPKVMIAGRVGDDKNGRDLLAQLQTKKIDVSLIKKDKDFTTTTKTRVLTKTQQIVRFDEEHYHGSTLDEAEKIVQEIPWEKVGVIALSDYGKGLLSNVMLKKILSTAKEKGVHCIADPKGADFSKYTDAFLITPNRKEAELALSLEPGSSTRDKIAELFQAKYPTIENAVITLGPEGMLLATSDGEKSYLAADSKDVFDVTGAGDTVVAIFALGILSGTSLVECMKFANAAAGVTITKQGTYAPSENEIVDSMQKVMFKGSQSKVMGLDACIHELSLKPKKKVVFTNGCFDLLHPGHVDYLEAARAMGDFLVIGVNSDESVQRLKGPTRPVQTSESRKRVLAGLASVDFVVEFGADTPLELIKSIKPDVLVKGGDWAIDKIVGGDFVSANGGTVCNIAVTEGHSTTSIVNHVKTNGS